MLNLTLCSLAAVAVSTAVAFQAGAADRPFAERQASPPAEARILKIVHGLPDAPEDQDRLLDTLAAQGFGGIVTNVSFQNYLEDEARWAAFERGITAAKDRGMALWLYDEKGYPSGTAGGIVLRDHPDWAAKGLLIADKTFGAGPVALDLPPGEFVCAEAFREADGVVDTTAGVDLAAHVAGNRLAWEAPEGRWRVLAFTRAPLYEGTHAAVSLADKLPYINLLMPEPTARFLEVNHAAYAARLGDDLGKWFIATFTDEPSLMSVFMQPQPWRVLPWAPNLAADFQARRGYALDTILPALVVGSGPAVSRARYDFWQTIGELVSENYFGQIQSWCRAHQVPSGGHLLCEEGLLNHVAFYGDFFACARRVDAPSMDCLTSIPEEVPWYVARLIGSVADLEERPVTMSETSDHGQVYRPEGDTRPVRQVTEEEIRGTCNKQILNGITTITSYYSFKGLSNEQLVRLNEWVGRCSTALQGGCQVADIAVLYPIESLWPHFVPSRHWMNDASDAAHAIDSTHRTVSDMLYGAARDFTYIDSRALAESTAEAGALRHGSLAWRALVLPRAETLPLAAWERVAEFWRAGGIVMAVGALPANSETEFPSPAVQALAKEVFGPLESGRFCTNNAGGAGLFLADGMESLLPAALDAVLDKDMTTSETALRVTHRRVDEHDVYFVINDGRDKVETAIGLSGTGPGERWDPATGAMTPVEPGAAIRVALEPFGGALFRFSEASTPNRRPAPDSALPTMAVTALPDVDPVPGAGEFVRSTIERTDAGWRAVGTITKTGVDTFLFLGFNYPAPLDLSRADHLVLDVTNPEQPECGARITCLITDADDVMYMTTTRIFLRAGEPHRAFLPRSTLHRAPWSKGPDQPLDWSRIKAISVGWGGYLGQEGERVEFTLGPVSASTRP